VIAGGSRGVYGRHALRVGRGGAHVRATLDEEARHVGMVKEDRQAEGRITVARGDVERVWIFGELPLDSLEVAECTGLGE
jgi:NAD(P)-dependent dehydrogenase (short-subunit alcohol dehydrogenase family)